MHVDDILEHTSVAARGKDRRFAVIWLSPSLHVCSVMRPTRSEPKDRRCSSDESQHISGWLATTQRTTHKPQDIYDVAVELVVLFPCASLQLQSAGFFHVRFPQNLGAPNSASCTSETQFARLISPTRVPSSNGASTYRTFTCLRAMSEF